MEIDHTRADPASLAIAHLENFAEHGLRRRVAVPANRGVYWFPTFARPLSSCRTAMSMPWTMSSGSKPVTTSVTP